MIFDDESSQEQYIQLMRFVHIVQSESKWVKLRQLLSSDLLDWFAGCLNNDNWSADLLSAYRDLRKELYQTPVQWEVSLKDQRPLAGCSVVTGWHPQVDDSEQHSPSGGSNVKWLTEDYDTMRGEEFVKLNARINRVEMRLDLVEERVSLVEKKAR